MKKYFLFLAAAFTFAAAAKADIVLPKIFADNMVLQRNAPVPVWGRAGAGEKIEVKFNRQIKTTRADKNGKWMLRLDAEAAGGPYELSITGKTAVLFRNVLVGEVWLCSGQSNMEFTVKQADNAPAEMASASYPLIRHIKIEKDISTLAKDDFKEGTWQLCSPATVGGFSAVGYYFARDIYNELHIPVGIIHSSWGGTNIETWISRQGFESSDEFKEMIAGMPLMNMDSLADMKLKAIGTRIEKLQGTPIGKGSTGAFKESSFNDAAWPEMNLPQLWENAAPGDIDGVVWMRKTVTLSAADAGKTASLELAKIDDDDICFVNGIKVGSTSQYDAERAYSIPAGILTEGKNIIAVRVTDNGGGGGIYGDASHMLLTTAAGNRLPLNGTWKYQVESVKTSMDVNAFPSLAYNAMINPVVPFALQGVLWYQGESNAGRAYQYRKAFPVLINDWRKKWNKADMPFYFVQLATYRTEGNSNEGSAWAELREAQTLTLRLPGTGMAVATDVGNPADIHPTNKQDVGKRLAAIALNNLYGKTRTFSGPVFQQMEIKNNEAVLSFSNTGGGLITPDKYGYLKGFEIAGADHVFHYARALIKGNTVVVSSDKVPVPLAVHFGWAGDASDNNLFNAEGFPAVPFRTDEWKTVTKANVYRIEKL